MSRTRLYPLAAALLLAGCARDPEAGLPPPAAADSAFLADTAKRDVVDLEEIRPPGLPEPVIAGNTSRPR
jgi:hypothetical protein